MTTNKKIRVCNLFAGIGGNRKNWTDVEVTAVELDENIAAIYQDFFPNDKVIIGDAEDFLRKHYKDFDFIWASPPCQSHSQIRFMASKNGDYDAVLPNMSLWSHIIFLQHFPNCKWVVENVRPYYSPLVTPTCEIDRHLFWSNFFISSYKQPKEARRHNHIKANDTIFKVNLDKYQISKKKVQILRNMVNPELGKHIFDCAFNGKAQTLFESQEMIQDNLFAEV